jgi:type I restriction enzyme S subunit
MRAVTGISVSGKWPIVPLSAVAEITAGGPAPQEAGDFSTNGTPFVRMQDVGKEHHCSNLLDSVDHISNETAERKRLRLFRNGSLLIPKSGASVNLNHRALLGADAYVVSHLAVVIPDRTKLDPEYLYFWSLTYDPRHQAQVTSLPSLPLSLINKAEILLPSLSEQRRIVDILKRADGIRRLRNQAIQTARELIPALFVDMFGKQQYPVWRLGDVADVVSGVTKGRRFNGQKTVVVPYLRVANVQAGHLDLSEIKMIEVLPTDVGKLALQKGDVLLTEGGDYDKLGRGALWDCDIDNCIHQNHVFRVRTDRSKLDPVYFVNFLQTQSVRLYFLKSAKRTTNLASINMTQLRSLPVPVPLLSDQKEFVARAIGVKSIERQHETADSRGDQFFQSILHRAFRGEL